MEHTNRFVLAAIFGVVGSVVHGAGGGPVPLSTLRQQADVIVTATLEDVSDTGQTETVVLRVVKVLQGQVTSLSVSAQWAPPAGKKLPMLPSTAIGTTGVWFLKTGTGVYQLLPLIEGPYRPQDAFIPVPDPAVVFSNSGTVDQQLLAYLASWYQSLSTPAIPDDQRLYISLTRGSQPDGLVTANTLVGSILARQHTIGLAAAIRLGSEDAISRLADEVPTLQPGQNFFWVLDSLRLYQPQSGASPAPLERLISARSDIPGLDDAAGAALQKFGTKAILPGMRLLLDSKDPNAQLRAARFFGYFTLFAQTDGSIPRTGVVGPLATAETRNFTPRRDAAITPLQYAEFWKSWWTDNKARFGF